MPAFDVISAADPLGLDVRPFEEATFESLAEVPKPGMAMMEGPHPVDEPTIGMPSGAYRFVVVFEADAQSVLVGDPKKGAVERWDRKKFEGEWTRDFAQMIPNPERITIAKRRTWEFDGPLMFLDIRRPYTPYMWFVLGAIAIIALPVMLVFGDGLDPVPVPATTPGRIGVFALATALLASLWAGVVARDKCEKCEKAAWHAGDFPVAYAGIGTYGALFALGTFFPHELPLLLSAGIGFAVGGQIYFVGVLIKNRAPCPPCITTAVSAVTAAVCIGIDSTPPALWLEIATVCAGYGITRLMMPAFAAVRALAVAVLPQSLGALVAREAYVDAGRARVVMYISKDPKSRIQGSIYYSATRPALEAEFGDKVSFEEREFEHRWFPSESLLIVRGAVGTFVIRDYIDYDRVAATVRFAIETPPTLAFAETLVVADTDLLGVVRRDFEIVRGSFGEARGGRKASVAPMQEPIAASPNSNANAQAPSAARH